MSAHNSSSRRNVVLIGHGGVGKNCFGRFYYLLRRGGYEDRQND